jgi:hypothetical protein
MINNQLDWDAIRPSLVLPENAQPDPRFERVPPADTSYIPNVRGAEPAPDVWMAGGQQDTNAQLLKLIRAIQILQQPRK